MSLRPPYFFHISDLSSFLPVVQSFVPWVLAPLLPSQSKPA